MTKDLQVVPARRGRAVRLAKGQAIQIINTHGQQVVDTWCFNADDLSEFMSMEHLHASLQGIFPAKGDGLATNRRRPILMLEEDTSPGRHLDHAGANLRRANQCSKRYRTPPPQRQLGHGATDITAKDAPKQENGNFIHARHH